MIFYSSKEIDLTLSVAFQLEPTPTPSMQFKHSAETFFGALIKAVKK